jgi:hypothetical protein
MALLNNGWVIGVGSGIISGVLVYWIVKIVSSRKDDEEYQQKLTTANKEVLYAIRPGISEGQLPDRDVIGALINATARRYSIPPDDLFPLRHRTTQRFNILVARNK